MIADPVSIDPAAERQERSDARRAIVVVNARAGTLLEIGLPAFTQRVVAAFDALRWKAQVVAVDGAGLAEALKQAAGMSPDLLVVAGGDGTVAGLLPVLRDLKRPVGILPLGTWNLLARDLGLGGTLEEDVAALAGGRRQAVDLVALNDTAFHSNAGLGFFATMAREREEARQRFPFSRVVSIAWAGLRTVLFSRAVHVVVAADGPRQDVVADAVLVTNNRFEGTPWRRPRLDEGVLEVHLLRAPGIAARLRCAVAFARGTWRDLPHLDSLVARDIEISRPGRRRTRLAIDGEQRRMGGRLHFRAEPGAIELIAREGSQEEGDSRVNAEKSAGTERDSMPGVLLA
jgi:diacylglycerol kinase family enzyme